MFVMPPVPPFVSQFWRRKAHVRPHDGLASFSRVGFGALFGAVNRRARSPKSALGTGTIGNANPAGGYHQKRAALEFLSVFIEHPVELFDLSLQGSAWKPKEQDAGVGEVLLEDELPEITVGNDQNPLLGPGDCQDILIGKTREQQQEPRENLQGV